MMSMRWMRLILRCMGAVCVCVSVCVSVCLFVCVCLSLCVLSSLCIRLQEPVSMAIAPCLWQLRELIEENVLFTLFENKHTPISLFQTMSADDVVCTRLYVKEWKTRSTEEKKRKKGSSSYPSDSLPISLFLLFTLTHYKTLLSLQLGSASHL